MNKSNNRSDIIILDIGQSFNDINETLAVLNEFKHYPMKNFIWIDHHKWKEEILHEFKNILLVQEKDSCAQVVNPDLINSFCRSIIFYDADCDGILSAVLMAAGNKLSQCETNLIIDIATRCDTADFISNRKAFTLHKAVYMARMNENTKNSFNLILEELLKWALNGMIFTKKIFNYTFELSRLYDENILKTNEEIIEKPIYNDGKIIVFNTSYIQWADLSYVCNYFYNLKFKYVLFVNTSGITINTNDKSKDLTKIFNQCGIKYKIFIVRKENHICDLQEIIDKINTID